MIFKKSFKSKKTFTLKKTFILKKISASKRISALTASSVTIISFIIITTTTIVIINDTAYLFKNQTNFKRVYETKITITYSIRMKHFMKHFTTLKMIL